MFRSTFVSIVTLFKEIRKDLKPEHVQGFVQTPFGILLSIIHENVDMSQNIQKYDCLIEKIIRCYDKESESFIFGKKRVKPESLDFTLVFGIRNGLLTITEWKDWEKCDFVSRLFPKKDGPNPTRVSVASIKKKIQNAVKRKEPSKSDVADVVRLINLYLFATLFVPAANKTFRKCYIPYFEDLASMCNYDWSSFILEKLHKGLKGKRNRNNYSGCLIFLVYWLCEKTHMLEPERHDAFPRILKYNMKKLKKLCDKVNDLSEIESNLVRDESLVMEENEEVKLSTIKSNLVCDESLVMVEREATKEVVTNHKTTAPPEVLKYLLSQCINIQNLRTLFGETKQAFYKAQLGWEKEFQWLGNHIKGLEVSASSYHEILEENRVLYNQVQDLKGTIRVFCRIKPFSSEQYNGQSTVDYIGENGNLMIVNPLKQGKDARRVFSLNKIFGTNVTQQQIFGDIQPLVRSVLDGYNVCIFAYGQTGSGKTYTMSGPDLTTEDTCGVNYRALRDLFHVSKARLNAIEYEVGVQMIEIYNEQVRDLLVSDGSNRRLDIRNNSQLNGLNVPDASLIPVKNTQDVLDLMMVGLRNRAVGATALNERSSRSHSILTVHVRGKELVSSNLLKGCLHLVDLAGSKRVDKSEAVGERLKEAQNINRSLSALGDVIAALAQKNSHVPYRNSKLTQVLQDSLGGHAKTLMFVHINPEVNAVGETISTLKFAQRVATIDLGAAQSNKETGEIKELRDEISKLKETLEQKEAELEQLKTRTNVRRAASPLRTQKHNNAILKPETTFPHMDTRDTEMRCRSTGKQRKSNLPSKFMDKDFIPKMPILAEERSVVDSISPPSTVKRSTSTDRATLMRTKTKPGVLENQKPVSKLLFPSRVPMNKSVASLHSTIPSVPSVLNNFQRVTIRNIHPENEEEQFKQALDLREGGIRKINTNQVSTRVQKSGVGETMISDTDTSNVLDETQKVDLPDSDNDHGTFKLPSTSTTGARRLQRTPSRNSQNVEPREPRQTLDSILAGYQENKPSNAVLQNVTEPSNSSLPEFRGSRSTQRGKYFI